MTFASNPAVVVVEEEVPAAPPFISSCIGNRDTIGRRKVSNASGAWTAQGRGATLEIP